MNDNYQLVTDGFQLLNEMLAPYVAAQLQGKFGRENWWREGVLGILFEEQLRDLPREGEWGELVDSLEPARCLLLIDLHWNSVFKCRGRYWYNTNPNLRRTVEDRAQQYKADEIEFEIENRIRAGINRGDFAAVHIVFGISDDVPDNQEARLVILGPSEIHKHAQENSPAIQQATTILNQRGNGPRIYRNMLVFVVPDKDLVEQLKSEVRYYLA